MCGIVAVRLNKKRIERQKLKVAIDALDHRGPDDKSVWFSAAGDVGLAHARLSVIGLNNGQQPLISKKHDIYAIVNGEFYDYKTIKDQCRNDGYEFLTDSDSEIIIPLYLKFGEGLFHKLNGEFSFILYDQRKNIFLAARDRFGIKPLFYHYENNNFYAASEVKALITLGLPVEWDKFAVEGILKGIPRQHLSCFKNIKQIKSGHYLKITKNTISERAYWDHKFEINNSIHMNEEDYISLFKEKLSSAIKKRLVSDAPLGFYLSGGIDSSSILALSAQHISNIKAFNISFEDSRVDESLFAKEMASRLGVELSSILVRPKDLADNFSNVIYHCESLIFQTNGIAKYLLSQHVRDLGYKVVLTGEGADETLAGYPFFKEDLLNNMDEKTKICLGEHIKNHSSQFIAAGDFDVDILNRVKEQLHYLPSLWKLSFDIGRKVQTIYSEHYMQFSKKLNPMDEFIKNFLLCKNEKIHPVNKSAYIFYKTIFPELVLAYLGDRLEMAHSIEARLPFLDLELVEFCNNLPIELKIKKFREKYILYEAVKGLIPESIYNKNKHALTAPSIYNDNEPNVKTPLEMLMYDVFHSVDFKDVEFFDQAKTIHMLTSIRTIDPSQRRFSESSLNFALSAYFLMKNFMK